MLKKILLATTFALSLAASSFGLVAEEPDQRDPSCTMMPELCDEAGI